MLGGDVGRLERRALRPCTLEMLITRPHSFSYMPGSALRTSLKGASSMTLSIREKRSGGKYS